MHNFRQRPIAAAIACTVGMMFSVIPIMIGTMPFFLGPIAETFGWSRGIVGGVMIAPALVAAVTSPFVGRAVDRFGALPVVVTGMVIYGCGMLGMTQLGASVPQMYANYGVIALGGVLCSLPFPKVISTRFDQNRALVLALAAGVAPAIMIGVFGLVVQYLISHYDWRHAYLALGLAVLLIPLPVQLLLLRDVPASGDDTQSALRKAQPGVIPGLTFRAAIRTRAYWTLAAAMFLTMYGLFGFRIHSVVLLTDRGFSVAAVTFAVTLTAIVGPVGQILAGITLDRFGTPKTGVPFFVASLLGVALMDAATTDGTLFAGACLVGFGFGADITLMAYYVSRFFGLRAFGTIFGSVNSMTALASGLGPLVMGVLFERTGSYRVPLSVAEGALLASALLVFCLGPYKYPSRRQEARTTAGLDTPSLAPDRSAPIR